MLRYVEKYVAPIAILLLLSIGTAWALGCRRCGRSSCRGGCFGYVAPYVAPVVAAPNTNVFVVQANYPNPLIGQGQSPAYSAGPQGFGSQALPFLDVNAYAQTQLQLIKAADQTNAIASERSMAFVQRVAELQAPAVERLAAGSAAAMVLSAAGLNPSVQGVSQSQAVVIEKDSAGNVRVRALEATEVQRIQTNVDNQLRPAPPVATPSPDAPPPIPPEEGANLGRFCYTCHGSGLATPAKGLKLGDTHELAGSMKLRFFDIAKRVKSKTKPMPPADYKDQPTDEERAAILNEIGAIISKHDQE